MRFSPNAHESVRLLGADYVVQAREGTLFPHESEGARAIVYRVSDRSARVWALKVFKLAYRTPELLDRNSHLTSFRGVPGLSAAERQVVPPTDPIARTYPDLQYAVIMPWVQGHTWFDLLQLAEAGQLTLDPGGSLDLARRFLAVVRQLEARGCAHTDLSNGNLVVDFRGSPAVELLDLEEMFVPGTHAKAGNIGTRGYRHRTSDRGATTCRPEGDRYAAAIVAAEMLLISEPNLAHHATSEGFFRDHADTAVGKQYFELAWPYLDRLAPSFARHVARAWNSNTLTECPTISDLCAALEHSNGTSVVLSSATPEPSPQISWLPSGAVVPDETGEFWAQSPAPMPQQRDEPRPSALRDIAIMIGILLVVAMIVFAGVVK